MGPPFRWLILFGRTLVTADIRVRMQECVQKLFKTFSLTKNRAPFAPLTFLASPSKQKCNFEKIF